MRPNAITATSRGPYLNLGVIVEAELTLGVAVELEVMLEMEPLLEPEPELELELFELEPKPRMVIVGLLVVLADDELVVVNIVVATVADPVVDSETVEVDDDEIDDDEVELLEVEVELEEGITLLEVEDTPRLLPTVEGPVLLQGSEMMMLCQLPDSPSYE